MGDQTVFKRYEIKYLLSRQQMAQILEEIKPYTIPDSHGHSQIQSLYFDTPDFRIIRRSLEKPLYKEKLRLRSYGIPESDSTVFAEIKKKYDGVVYKRRVSLKLSEAPLLLPINGVFHPLSFRDQVAPGTTRAQIVKEIDYFIYFYKTLAPSMMIQYERDAFYAKDDSNFRITFDDNILWRRDELSLDKGFFGNPILSKDKVLMEVKTGNAVPLWFSTILTKLEARRISYSKYGNAYLMYSGLKPETEDK